MNKFQKEITEANLSKFAEYFNSKNWLILVTTFVYLDTYVIAFNKFSISRHNLVWEQLFSLGNLTEFIITTSLVYLLYPFFDIISNLIFSNKYIQSFFGIDNSRNTKEIIEPYYASSDILQTAIIKKNTVLLALFRAWEAQKRSRILNRKIAFFLLLFSLCNVYFHGSLITVVEKLVHAEAWANQVSIEIIIYFLMGAIYMLYWGIERESLIDNQIQLGYGLKDEIIKYDVIVIKK